MPPSKVIDKFIKILQLITQSTNLSDTYFENNGQNNGPIQIQ